MDSFLSFTGSGGCSTGYAEACSHGWGAIAIDGAEIGPWAYFERVDALQVEMDVVDGPAPFHAVHPHHDDLIHVVVMGASTAVGDPVDLDTDLIDPATLRFSHSRATTEPTSIPQAGYNHDADGLDDAKFEFLTGDTSLGCLDTEVLIEGELTAGQAFTAKDTDFNSDCDAGCH